MAWLITALWIVGAGTVLASGIGRRAEWGEISKPLLIGGGGSMALALTLALVMRLVRPGWRADRELRDGEKGVLWKGTLAILAIGLLIGFVVRVA